MKKTQEPEGYNAKSIEKLPYIVVFIDEMADLMMTAGKEVEHYVQRLAQMAEHGFISDVHKTKC